MIPARLLVSALALSLLPVGPAAAQSITVGSAAVIASATEPHRYFEPHLAIHPTNPKHLLAGVVLAWSQDPFQDARARARCATLVSHDGGTTWARHEFNVVDCIDPQVAILPNGGAVFVALGELPGVQPRDNGWLLVFQSEDGGATWTTEPTVIGRSHDHPAIAVDLSSPARKGWIYITSHYAWRNGEGGITSGIFAVRSRNGGKTFDAPAIVSPNHLHNFSEMPAVLTDGTVVASFVDDRFDPPYLERRRAWVIRSDDGASTFSSPFLIDDNCGPPPSFQLSALVSDRSVGPHRDRLYFACREHAGGPVVVSASGDRGRTWNRAVPAGPTTKNAAVRRVMTLAVDGRGVLGVLVGERGASSGPNCLTFTFSASFDGGATFTEPRSLSASACGTTPQDDVAARRIPTYGDYFGVVGIPDGGFRAVWPEMRDGHSVLLTGPVSVHGDVVAPGNDSSRR